MNISPLKLSQLYRSDEIAEIWYAHQGLAVIKHPIAGLISPNQYRKINKARCPEKMFDFDNLQLICWQCNREKGDDNAYEISHIYQDLHNLANEVLASYPIL